ncbi:MAG: DNA primase [Bacilli bacterium]|nr:DNA primase [Bacilli bacterium]
MNINIGQVHKVQSHSVLHDIYNLSLKFFINNINTSTGNKAKEYLLSRNLTQNIIKEFQIGLSLDKRDALSKILSKKYKDSDLMKSGLVGKSDYGYYDLFLSRIMFPLYDLNGNVIAYSGRIYKTSDSSKYFNTRETEIFKKGKLLYNYHRAKESARQKNQIIVMEGFMDVIRAYTIGIKNVVATMGTAVTADQANLIKRLGKDVILCFDGDAAGAKATMSCADELMKIGVTPTVIRLEDNLDPDEYIQKYGKEFQRRIDNPMSIMDFKLNYLKANKNLNNTVDEANYISEAIKEIEKIDDEILREVTIKKLVTQTNIDENLIRGKLNIKPKEKVIKKEKKISLKTNKYEVAQRNLIYYMFKSPEVIKMYDNRITYMPSKEYRMLAREISMFYRENNFIDMASFIDFTHCDEEVLETIKKINYANLKEKYTIKEIEDYINVIKDYNVKNETKRLQEQLKEELDPIKQAAIAQKIIDLKKGV